MKRRVRTQSLLKYVTVNPNGSTKRKPGDVQLRNIVIIMGEQTFMPIQSLYVLSEDDPEARGWLSFFRRHGYDRLTSFSIERVVWLEGRVDVSKLMPLLVNPLYQTASDRTQLDPARGPIIEIAYRPAVTDPETPSILEAARALGEDSLEFARLGRRYQFFGLENDVAQKLAARFL